MKKTIESLAVVALALVVGCTESPAVESAETAEMESSAPATTLTPAPGEPALAEIRAATERFRDVEVAIREGYIPDPSGMCVTAEMEGLPASAGAMGVHYLRPDLLGVGETPEGRVTGTSTHTDFRNPAVLIYEPQADGSQQLVAVENLVFISAWEAAGNREPPSLHGLPYDRMVDDPNTAVDEAHNFEPHFDRHVWIYRENPTGVFTPMNPTVTCDHHGHSAA